MITIVQDYNRAYHSEMLDQMFKMRADVFGTKLGWSVNVAEGLEKDIFDEQSPVYVISTDEYGEVEGSCRLLPTTGPTLVSEVFSDCIPDGALLSSPTIWECTRFCVDYRQKSVAGRQSTALAASRLVSAVGTLCASIGIETVLGNFDALMLRIYDRIGCRVQILGSTNKFGSTVYLGSFPVRRDDIDQLNVRIAEAARQIHIQRAA